MELTIRQFIITRSTLKAVPAFLANLIPSSKSLRKYFS